ncbi:MAG TPA: hypothetical protein VFJ06_04595 [Halococcus sp.]|nr:hypothetical protein [Halococcus sp.]
MRNYPATLVRVFENKLDAGADTDDDISFDRDDVEQALTDLDIDVRDPMEIPSTYSSTRSLPEDITEYGYSDIELVESGEAGETYRFVR